MNKHKISVEILKSEKMLQTKTDYLCIYIYVYGETCKYLYVCIMYSLVIYCVCCVHYVY